MFIVNNISYKDLLVVFGFEGKNLYFNNYINNREIIFIYIYYKCFFTFFT